MKKTTFSSSSQNTYIKDKDTMNHWVGHSKMYPIGVDELFEGKFIINELESSLNNDDETEASVVVAVVQEDIYVII